MTKWRNWQTRDAQNVVPFGIGSSNPGTAAKRWSLVTETLQARQVPNWPGTMRSMVGGRCARFDTGACNCYSITLQTMGKHIQVCWFHILRS
jgi:hypothetical protein